MRPFPLSLYRSPVHFSLYAAFFSTRTQGPPPPSPSHQPLQKDTNTLQNHQSHTNNNADPLQYVKAFSNLTTTLSRNPRNFNALRTLDSILNQTESFDSSTLVFIIHCLSRLKKLGRAKTVLSYLKFTGKVSDYFLYSLVVDCLVKDGKIDDVETVWAEICGSESPSIPRIDISDYVIYVCKWDGVCEIKSISERILLGCRVLKKQSYIALIGALCRVNEGLLAKEIAREMYYKGLKVDDLTYFVMFQCFCKNGDLDEADLILRKLVRRRYHIDICCIHGSFTYALCKSGKLREANKLFHKLIKRDCSGGSTNVKFLKEGRRAIFQLNCDGVVPQMMAYEMYFRSLCSVGRLDKAEVLLKKMMKMRTVPQICVYGSFIKALFQVGRDEDAMKFFNVERKKGIIRVDEIARFIIMGLCEMGKVDDALRIFDEVVMTAGGVSCLSICNCILESYWRLGRVVEAESLFERLRNGSLGLPDVLTYTIMINGYCNQENVSKALRLFEEMLKSDIRVNGTLYVIIFQGLCSCRKLKEALKNLNDMIENGHLVSCMRWKVLFQSMFTGVEHGISLGF
ncbi:hypothetical protein F0562_035726 [Nyssa sinensis]|uniref:Pentacotripeptide-repeat region of PRORP domain-containing protein n=1 Tax=Nyssa sinensis TaxID=561372 RepID=A0A5J5AGV1_9ASTE|nr:hypothetical protein F0562_035726 [Nyssa sinensis]